MSGYQVTVTRSDAQPDTYIPNIWERSALLFLLNSCFVAVCQVTWVFVTLAWELTQTSFMASLKVRFGDNSTFSVFVGWLVDVMNRSACLYVFVYVTYAYVCIYLLC